MANNVAKKQESKVAKFDASIFEADAGKGLENVGQEDLALPFIKILSGLDPILDDLEEARKAIFIIPSQIKFIRAKRAYK